MTALLAVVALAGVLVGAAFGFVLRGEIYVWRRSRRTGDLDFTRKKLGA